MKFKRSSGQHFVESITQRELCAGTLVVVCVGLDVIQKEAWPFYRTIPVSAYVGSSTNLKDLGASGAPGARIERASRAIEVGRQ